jgi:hypothetical protein
MAMPNRRLPKHPSGPNRILIAALGLAGGLLLGALTAVVARPPPRYGSSRKFTEIVVTTSTGWPFSSVG